MKNFILVSFFLSIFLGNLYARENSSFYVPVDYSHYKKAIDLAPEYIVVDVVAYVKDYHQQKELAERIGARVDYTYYKNVGPSPYEQAVGDINRKCSVRVLEYIISKYISNTNFPESYYEMRGVNPNQYEEITFDPNIKLSEDFPGSVSFLEKNSTVVKAQCGIYYSNIMRMMKNIISPYDNEYVIARIYY